MGHEWEGEGKITGMVREARDQAKEDYKAAVAETKGVEKELAKRERRRARCGRERTT